jgi:hypothetical protein
MTVTPIIVMDLSNPVEVNVWFRDNPTIQLHSVVIEGSAFYIFYE